MRVVRVHWFVLIIVIALLIATVPGKPPPRGTIIFVPYYPEIPE